MNHAQKLKDYASLLLHWNKTHNLSGAKTVQEVEENIADCLYPMHFISAFKSAIDIGSGAGFPAIPLAIQNPQSLFFLTEPRKKRASFLQMLKIELELENIELFPCILQEAPIPQKVDLITSRAVAPTPLLIQISQAFLLDGGAFLFYKGSKLLEEGEKIGDNEIFTSPKSRIYFYRRKI